jgi:hypothetical protein
MWWSLGIGGRFLSPGVTDRPLHEQPSGQVKERQATSFGLCSHHRDHLVDPLGLAALFAPPSVHLRRLGSASTRWRRLNAKSLQQSRQLGARAADGLYGKPFTQIRKVLWRQLYVGGTGVLRRL